MTILRLQSPEAKFTMSHEIEPVRRPFRRHGSRTFNGSGAFGAFRDLLCLSAPGPARGPAATCTSQQKVGAAVRAPAPAGARLQAAGRARARKGETEVRWWSGAHGCARECGEGLRRGSARASARASGFILAAGGHRCLGRFCCRKPSR